MGGKRSNVHVTPRDDGWAVKREGAQRATKVVSTQAEAARIARDIARSEKGETFIHNRENLIRERNSYGNDDFPPEG